MYCASCGTQLTGAGPCPACGRVPAVAPGSPDPLPTPPDHWMTAPVPPGPPTQPPGAWPAPALPAPPAYVTATPVRPGRSPFAMGVGLAGVFALLLVMVFVVRGMNGQGTGASSPEDLVEKLQNAVNKEDPAAVLALLDPDELPTLGDLFETAVRNLDKTQDIDIDGARAALDLEVHDLDYETTALGAAGDYAKVTFHAGRTDWQTDPGKLPDAIKAKAREDGDELPEPESGTVNVEDLQVSNDDGDVLDPFFVLVKTGGRWYVSISMTAGEYAVTVAGLPGGDFDQSGSGPSTAHSPEEAVRQFIDGTVDAAKNGGEGYERLTNLLPDGQTRALRVYAKALDRSVDDPDENEDDDNEFALGLDKFEVENLELSTGSSHGQTTVRIDRMDLSWESQYQSCFSAVGSAIEGDDYDFDPGGSNSYDDSNLYDEGGDGYDFDPGGSNDFDDSNLYDGSNLYDEGDYSDEYGTEECSTEHETVELHWDGHCATVTSTYAWFDSDSEWTNEDEREPETGCLNDDTGPDELGPADFGITDIHIVVKQERGGWVIDPIATLMDYGRTALEHFDTPKVRRLLGHEI